MLAAIVKVLDAHRFVRGDNTFRCSCMESAYGRNRRAAVEAHDIHTAQELVMAGLRIAPKDPREAFRARVTEN